MKYVRFQSLERCYYAPSKVGIFQIAGAVCDDHETFAYFADAIGEQLNWFNTYLHVPKYYTWDDRVIFWFKDSAHEPLARIWAMKPHLEACGYWIDVVKTARPGRIFYEDGWQIAAKPWRDGRY